MSDFRLIPLYNPEALLAAWPVMQKGVDRVLEFTHGDEDEATIWNNLLSGHLLAWMAFYEGKYVGFATTLIRVNTTDPPTKTLVINHAYRKPDYKGDFKAQILKRLEAFAVEQGCSDIRFFSSRAFDKIIRPYGFEPGYTEYRKVLNE